MNIKPSRALLLAIALTLLAAWAPAPQMPPLPSAEPVDAAIRPGYILIETDRPEAAAAGRAYEHIFGDWYRVALGSGEAVMSTMATLQRNPAIFNAEPEYIMTTHEAPDDPFYELQWHMPQVQLEQAWDVATGALSGGGGVRLAILDTGVGAAAAHPAGEDGFCNPFAAEYDVFTDSDAPGAAADDDNHGTHVAGTAAGCAHNGVGVAGIAYEAELMAVRVLNKGGGTSATVAAGMVWAIENGARVINMSVGEGCIRHWPDCQALIINEAMDLAQEYDVVVVSSAGNNNRQYVGMPANHPYAISVSATGLDKAKAGYSNYGNSIDIAAPGGVSGQDLNDDGYIDGVLQETFGSLNSSGIPRNWNYYFKAGTSMSSPHVAGAAALLRSCAPEATAAEVREALEQFTLDLGPAGWDNVYGNGFLQIYDALLGLAYRSGRDPADHCAETTAPPPCFTVSAAADGPGTVTVDPPPNCDPDGDGPQGNTAYAFDTLLTFSATPDEGALFHGWSGDLEGTATTTTRRVARDLTAAAAFAFPPPEPGLIVSMKAKGSAGGIAYGGEDLLRDDPDDGLSLLFDGSARGMGAKNIDAMALMPDGTYLLSSAAVLKKLPGMETEKVDDSDIIRYNPATGQYSWYFDGSDVGLTTAAEDIDAIALLPDGRLLISTQGAVNVTGVKATGADVLLFSGVLGSAETSGEWELFFDASDIAKALVTTALDFDPGGTTGPDVLYLASNKKVTLDGWPMTKGDVIRCELASTGDNSACVVITRHWQGTAAGFNNKAAIDALEVYWPD